MPDRRTEILDTAIAVLAGHGMRGLTHRAVDRAAGLPAGSTSYYFRTREALVNGCVHRLLELDRGHVPAGADPDPAASAAPAAPVEPSAPAAPLAPAAPSTPSVPAGAELDALADRATEACLRMATTHADRTMARYELALHAIRTPSVRAEMVEAGDQLRGLIAAVLGALGAADPRRAAEEIAAVIDGLVFTALVRGPREAAELRRWLRPQLRRALSAHLPD